MTRTQMTPGGKWLRLSHDVPAVYIPPTQETHIQRLRMEGAEIIDDPRGPEEEAPVSEPVDAEKAAMQARIDKLEAMLQQVLSQQGEKNASSTTDDDAANSGTSSDDSGSAGTKSAVRGSRSAKQA